MARFKCWVKGQCSKGHVEKVVVVGGVGGIKGEKGDNAAVARTPLLV